MLCLQEELMAQYEEEHAKYKADEYQESPQTWLHSSWQGAALQVRSSVRALRRCECVPARTRT